MRGAKTVPSLSYARNDREFRAHASLCRLPLVGKMPEFKFSSFLGQVSFLPVSRFSRWSSFTASSRFQRNWCYHFCWQYQAWFGMKKFLVFNRPLVIFVILVYKKLCCWTDEVVFFRLRFEQATLRISSIQWCGWVLCRISLSSSRLVSWCWITSSFIFVKTIVSVLQSIQIEEYIIGEQQTHTSLWLCKTEWDLRTRLTPDGEIIKIQGLGSNSWQ